MLVGVQPLGSVPMNETRKPAGTLMRRAQASCSSGHGRVPSSQCQSLSTTGIGVASGTGGGNVGGGDGDRLDGIDDERLVAMTVAPGVSVESEAGNGPIGSHAPRRIRPAMVTAKATRRISTLLPAVRR